MLAEPDAFGLVAEADGAAVGYALVHMRGSEKTWAPVTAWPSSVGVEATDCGPSRRSGPQW